MQQAGAASDKCIPLMREFIGRQLSVVTAA